MIARSLLAAALLMLGLHSAGATRIKDIVSVQGVRPNQLVGYGLVIGLNGTGDSLRNAPFTEQSLQSMLDRMGINVRTAKARTRNVAAVMVTAELPAFTGKGARIDTITVQATGPTTAGMIRLFVGTTLVREIAVTAITPSATVKAFTIPTTEGADLNGRLALGLVLAPGDALKVGTEKAESFVVRAEGGEF